MHTHSEKKNNEDTFNMEFDFVQRYSIHMGNEHYTDLSLGTKSGQWNIFKITWNCNLNQNSLIFWLC